MRYLSVCSGIEAVSVAWQPLGWQPAMFAEIDPFCCCLLRSRYRASRPVYMPSPHDAPTRKEAKQRAAAIRNIVALPADGAIMNAGDFTKIGKQDVGAIDLMAGGTPCQSFSVAGKRAGLDDPRGNLTLEFARLADLLRPPWLVWENVPGVLSIDGGRTFGAFLRMLVECGYGIAYRILNAEHFGVPQRRRRVFVVGCAGDWRPAAAVLLEQLCLSGYPPPRREARQGTAGGIEVGPAGGRFTDTAPTIDAGCKDGFVRNQLGAGVLCSTDETSHFLNAGGMGRQDFETETLLAHTLLAKENDSRDAEKQTYITHAFSADGFDASEDGSPPHERRPVRGDPGTGRGTPVVPVAICTAHTQSNGSGATQAVAFNLRGRDGGALPEASAAARVRAATGGSSNSYVAFSANDNGADANPTPSTLCRSAQMAITVSANQRGELRERPVHGSLSSTRSSKQFDGVMEEQTIASPLTASYGRQVDSSDTGSGPPNLLHSQMAVRRLTPRECERLQGFPDDYTLVEYRGRLAADGPRYKALGNSMAVPVMRWIGERIAQVDAILREQRGNERAG